MMRLASKSSILFSNVPLQLLVQGRRRRTKSGPVVTCGGSGPGEGAGGGHPSRPARVHGGAQ